MKDKAMDLADMQAALKRGCKCPKNCVKKQSLQKVRSLRREYWCQAKHVRKQMLKLYLKKSKVEGKHRYYVVGNGELLCSKSFLRILRINKNTLSVANKAVQGNMPMPERSSRKQNENTLQAINWIENYATFYGDRMPHTSDVKLPYKTRKKAVYQTYVKECENPVSGSQFFKMWKLYFPHLKIKKINSFSKCSTCTTLERQREKTVSVEERAVCCQLKQEHHERQQMERRYYYAKRDASRRNPSKSMSMIIDGMDQKKTHLPHFAGRRSKSVNPTDLLKTHITGVINHGADGFHAYVDINEYPHDPNLTINIILKALKRFCDKNENKLPHILYLQADNCFRENKNRFVLAFLELLIAKNIFNEVHLSFLPVGHTHEDVDAAFSRISEKLNRMDVETLNDMYALTNNIEPLGEIFDVKTWLSPYINNLIGTSVPLHYKFEKGMNNVKCYYKGSHCASWTEMEDNILNQNPNGQPSKLEPDFTKIDATRNMKQVEVIKNLFAKPDSLSFWQDFYTNIKDQVQTTSTSWILSELPQQDDTENDVQRLEVPEHIRNLIQKETATPKVTVKRKKSSEKTNQHGNNQRAATNSRRKRKD